MCVLGVSQEQPLALALSFVDFCVSKALVKDTDEVRMTSTNLSILLKPVFLL